eukprot:gnl/MRDRNA2_/MRDRNA2_48391_c0_seq2.p1 gnl/MRDRNA2_/MRDRNA2_48391_c0~~gnl/MRDRNA2_/MRDRNA2_48391_c0_seq2.p1  ORF type:complete len:756 (-),score=143.31 gnl/MRDRNA2_/MRDRNA2_48391_c0_seq2:148-2415(-)
MADTAAMPDIWAHILLVVPPVLGLVWTAVQWHHVSSIDVEDEEDAHEEEANLKSGDEPSESQTRRTMVHLEGIIAEGAKTFLFTEYGYMAVYIIIFSILIVAFYLSTDAGPLKSWLTMAAFIVGALTSIASGYIGMAAAVMSNVRTTFECWQHGAPEGLDVALRGGSIMGFGLCSIGVLVLYALIMIYRLPSLLGDSPEVLCETLAGFGLGGSSIALFGRVGGGIYTKAADVGADLSGKNEYGMEEDDPRNPACIADNVGDNVGDIAGMGADLFGSFAESTVAALVIASKGGIKDSFVSLYFPILVSSSGILVGVITIVIVLALVPKIAATPVPGIENVLKLMLIISTVLETPVVIVLGLYALPETFQLPGPKGSAFPMDVTAWGCITSILLGLWAGLLIGLVTEYYTSHSYNPVREIAESQVQTAATGIIYGLALGYLSCVIPVLCLAVIIIVANSVAGMYGIALAALGMLSTLTMGLTIDGYGPISDNAGGIAEMAGLEPRVRELTDALDAAGNTTAAIGKGFAIGSAALVALALFGAFKVRAGIEAVDVADAWTFSGLLVGALLPYAFSAMTMKSVGQAAQDMVKECMEQFPKIINEGAEPDYERCIKISTEASLKEMIAPGLLVILSPLVCGLAFGRNATAGLLSGALVSGVQLAISMSNTGGAWDNSKKFIKAGGLEEMMDIPKDSEKWTNAHKNSVTGDTVGDPLKDTSGPSLNILVKLSAITSLVFAEVVSSYSNEAGGPFWMSAPKV